MNPTLRRVLVYAAIYGTLGASLGVMLALWTKDADEQRKSILLKMSKKSETVKEPEVTEPVLTKKEVTETKAND